MKGLVHIYTGNGKGKTTAALGLVFRALGWNKQVCFIQFVKGYKEIGELNFSKFIDNLKFIQVCNSENLNITENDIENRKFEVENAFDIAKKEAFSDKYDLMILDEINCAINFGLIDVKEVADFIRNKPEKLELVLTGRNAKDELKDLADYVTDMGYIKHPIKKNIYARKGIEF